jgi:hypothetical protein
MDVKEEGKKMRLRQKKIKVREVRKPGDWLAVASLYHSVQKGVT